MFKDIKKKICIHKYISTGSSVLPKGAKISLKGKVVHTMKGKEDVLYCVNCDKVKINT